MHMKKYYLCPETETTILQTAAPVAVSFVAGDAPETQTEDVGETTFVW